MTDAIEALDDAARHLTVKGGVKLRCTLSATPTSDRLGCASLLQVAFAAVLEDKIGLREYGGLAKYRVAALL